MGFGPIQFGGLGSGLDTSAIINALLAVEAQPLQLLNAQKATNESKVSLLGTLEGLVGDLEDAAEKLSTEGGFFAYALTGDESVATFSFTGAEAAEGPHTLQVNSLATVDRYAFDPATTVTDPTVDIGGGTVHFTYDGTTYDVVIGTNPGESSLNQIAADINTAADGAVSASVINVGTESSPDYQLVLAGEDTGADFAIGELDQTTIAALGTPQQLTAASNAEVVVDGLTVQRSDNVFSDVVPGVSFTVLSTTTGETSFSVETDIQGVKDNVQEFIDAYNAVVTFIDAQSQFSEEDGASSDLFGDSALSTVRSTINSALFNVDLATVQADTEGYSTLGLVGIDLQSDGTLLLDEATFDAKLADDIDALANLFTDETNGLAVKLDEAIELMVDDQTNELGDEIPGLFERRTDTLNAIIDDIDDQIEDLNDRLEQLEITLVQKFSALEELMAGLNAQSQFLAQNLPNPSQS